MATADLTVLALGRPQTGASEYIAEIQRRLAAQDRVGYRMHAMGTSLEGSVEDILAVVGKLHAVPFEAGIPRVYTVLKLDERRDKPGQTLEDKVRSVEEKLELVLADVGPGGLRQLVLRGVHLRGIRGQLHRRGRRALGVVFPGRLRDVLEVSDRGVQVLLQRRGLVL